jgi:serine/threonine protein kinase/Tol biopolymer transport system component
MLALDTTFGPYKILAPIGAGGMGEVYRARDTRLGRDVAIKVIPTEFAREPGRIQRFEQEARAAGALNHPNVCAIYDVGRAPGEAGSQGAPFVVMELLEGESLRARLRGGPLPVRKAIDYAAQAAHGLAAAHEKGIVHRDLKPENLFVTKDGRIKVLDFGLAKLTRPLEGAGSALETISAERTDTGAILGTVGYMSPEQVRGERADPRADLFALGAILYELVSGKRAFAGSTYVDVLSAILREEPPPLTADGRAVPPALELIVRRCLEKSPAQRFQNASDLAFDLESMSGSTERAAALADVGPPARRSAPRTSWILASIAALAIAAFVGDHTLWKSATANHPTYQRLTVQRGTLVSALFSPDAKTVLYSAGWDGRPPEVFDTRPGTLVSRPLGLEEANLLSISKRGTMALILGQKVPFTGGLPGMLAEVSISGGVPRSILERVSGADWSPDGGTLAILKPAAGNVRLEMPPGHMLYQSPGNLHYVRISPDGGWLALVDNPLPLELRGRVVIMDLTGHVLARSPELGALGGVAWSADGREVWFTACENGLSASLFALTPRGKLRVVQRYPGWMVLSDVARDGRVLMARRFVQAGIRGRRSPAEEERELGWWDYPVPDDISPDGKTLLFDEGGVGGASNYSIFLRAMDGSPPVGLGEGSALALSQDGRWVLALRYGSPSRLMLLPTGAGDSTSLPRGNIQQYNIARWLPDGRRFVFLGKGPGEVGRIYVQDREGGLPAAVTPDSVAGLCVSPDGRSVACYSKNLRVIAYPIGPGEPRAIATLEPGENMIRWTADGRGLFVTKRDSTGVSIRFARLDLETGRRQYLMTVRFPDPAGGRVGFPVITPDGRSYAFFYYRMFDDLYLVQGLK